MINFEVILDPQLSVDLHNLALYPFSVLTFDPFKSNKEERELLQIELIRATNANEVDLHILPYLERLNKTEKVTTVFSCWGHPKEGHLLLRLSIGMDEFLQKVAYPLQKQYDSVKPLVGLHTWEIPTFGKLFYAVFLDFPTSLKTDQDKDCFLKDLCRLIEEV